MGFMESVDNQNHVDQQNIEDQTSIDINGLLVRSILEDISGALISPVGGCIIYKVHEKFRKVNVYAYTPEIVSIGPFHHHRVNLQAMEDHKLQYMNEILTRKGNKEAKLLECVEAISAEEDKIRKCYSEPVESDRNKFVKIMIVDGLFIIELFCKSVGRGTTHKDDPLFSNIWVMSSLIRDLVLLENQLPMLVLDKLFSITVEKQGGESFSLSELAIRFFDPLMPRMKSPSLNYKDITSNHLLDFLRKTLLDFPQGVKPRNGSKQNDYQKFKQIPCLTDLLLAGVKFRRGSDSSSFLDIKFSAGTLEIPPILIQDQTETLFRNLIALEQCYDGGDTYMTSYAFLMDSLIDCSNDVAFLRRKGIITNYLGDDECVSSLFNKLCSEITLVDFYYSGLCNQLNAFYNIIPNVWYAKMWREYFRSPWTGFGFTAAVLLVVLTLVQTICTVLPFLGRKP